MKYWATGRKIGFQVLSFSPPIITSAAKVVVQLSQSLFRLSAGPTKIRAEAWATMRGSLSLRLMDVQSVPQLAIGRSLNCA